MAKGRTKGRPEDRTGLKIGDGLGGAGNACAPEISLDIKRNMNK